MGHPVMTSSLLKVDDGLVGKLIKNNVELENNKEGSCEDTHDLLVGISPSPLCLRFTPMKYLM